MSIMDENTAGGSGLLPAPKFPGTPSWPNLGSEEPANVQQQYMAERRVLENDRLSRLYLDDAEFARMSNEGPVRQARKLSLLGDDLPKMAANAAYLSHRTGKQVTAQDYQLYRDAYASQHFGQDKVNDSQFFDLVKGEYELQDKKKTALRDLTLRMAGQSLKDAVSGMQLPATAVFSQWRAEHQDILNGSEDLPYLAAAIQTRDQFSKELGKYSHLAGPGLELLQKFTAGEASDDDLRNFAMKLGQIPEAEREQTIGKVVDLIAMGAEAGQVDRGGLAQFARNLGQSFSRGFNFVPEFMSEQGDMALLEMRDVLNTGDVWLNGSGTANLHNIRRPSQVISPGIAPMLDLRGRAASSEDIQKLKTDVETALSASQLVRQLRAVADNNVDPIQRLAKPGSWTGLLEGGVYGVSGSLPYLTATAVNPLLGAAAYQATEYNRIRLENPNVDPRAAFGIAGVEGGWQAALDLLQLKTLQGALPVTGKLLGRIKSAGLRRTLSFAASAAEQTGQEYAQDLGTIAIDSVAAALREDMPDQNLWGKVKEYWKEQAGETFVASLIFGLWGGGAVTARDIKLGGTRLDEAARIAGITEEGRKRMQLATTPEELDAVVQRELKNVTPESRAAGALYAKAKLDAAKAAQADPNEPTLEIAKDDKGRDVFTLRTPENEVLIETTDPVAAQAAYLDFRTAASNNEVQALKDVISYWQNRDPNLSIEQAPAILVKNELERLQGIGDTARIERLHQRLVAAGIDPNGDLTGVRIFGSTTVQEVGENVYRGTILVREGASPQTVMEEVNHAFVRRALKRGDVTLDTLFGWLEQTAAATGLDIKRSNEIEIVESIAQVGMDLFNGRLDQAQLPQSLVDYLRRLMRVVKEIYLRAIKVTEAFDRGEIDGNFEQFLMQSMGLSAQQQIDINSTTNAEVLATGFDYSVGRVNRVDQNGIHPFAKPQPSRYTSLDEQERDPAAILQAILGRDGRANQTQRWKYGRKIASFPRLLAWAEANGKIIDPAVFAKRSEVGSGGEHLVLLGEPGRLFKLTKPGLAGAQAEDAGAYLQRWALNNRLFNDTARIEGLVKLPGDNDYRVVVSHAQIEGNDSTVGEIQEYLKSHGFIQVESQWIHPVLGLAALDEATPGNAITTPTNEVVPVDLNLVPASPKYLDQARKDSGLGRNTDFSVGRQSFKDWFGDWELAPTHASKVVGSDGRPLVVYHGTRRPDRVGNRFRKARATSGPMAFFTDAADLGSKYAEGKADTSLTMPDDYAGWFKFKGKGMRSAVDLDRAWNYLSQDERDTILQRIYTVGYENAEEATGPIVANSSSIMGRDSIDWHLRDARGNGLRALVDIWLNSGSMFNDEQAFMQVLEAAGMDMSRITYDSPHAVKSAVYPVYLSIKNPLDTTNIPANVIEALKQAGKRKRAKQSAGGNADAWDKNTISGKDWLDALMHDQDKGWTHAWTRIPDWVTATLEQLGYDGIKDTGGKFGGPKHQVWIPFHENQVKSATGNRGTFDPTDPRIDYSVGRPRVDRALASAMNRKPGERLAMYERAKQMFDRVAARRAGLPQEPGETTAGGLERIEAEKAAALAEIDRLEEIDIAEAQWSNLEKFNAEAKPDWDERTRKDAERKARERGRILEKGIRDKYNEQRKATEAGAKAKRLAAENAAKADNRQRKLDYEGNLKFSKALQGLWELDAILKVLPPEVRAKVGGYTSMAALGKDSPTGPTQEAVDKFLDKRLEMVGKQLDRYLANEYRIAIERTISAARPKKGDNGVRRSTLGPDAQAYADKVHAASLLDNDAVVAQQSAIEAELLNPETSDEAKIDLAEEWAVLNTFGDLESRNAETLAQGLQDLRDRLKAGRNAWRIQEEGRIADQREIVSRLVSVLGKAGKAGRFADKGAIQKFVDSLSSYGLSHLTFEQFVQAVLPDDSTVTRWSEMMRKADTGAEDMELRERERLLLVIRAAAKADGMSTAKALRKLKESAAEAVPAIDGRKVTTERVSIELAQKIVRGVADRGALSDQDVETLREELAALPEDTRKEFVTIQRVISGGTPVKVSMSPAQAMQLKLMWAQPDLQDKMRREGWTDESAAAWDKLTSDPVAQAVLGHLMEYYAGNHATVNPVYARMFGMNLPRVANYAPARFANPQNVADIGPDGMPSVSGSTPGFAKSRVNHSAPVDAKDALTVFQQHVMQTAHWVNFAEFAREAKAVINNLEVREAIRQNVSEEALQGLQKWVELLEQRGGNRARELAWLDQLFGTVIGGKAISALGFNLRTLMMQADSAMRFMFALNPREVMSALADPVGFVNSMPAVWNSPTIQRRLRGGMNPEAQFLFTRNAAKPGILATLSGAAMQPIQFFDAVATTFSSAIVFKSAWNEAKSAGLTDTLAEAAALEAMDRAVYRFSQPTGFGSKSLVENTGNSGIKMFMLFMSDPRLKTGIMLDAVRGIAKGKNVTANIRRLVAVEAMALVSHIIASAYRDAFSDDDDEEIWSVGGFAKALLLAPLQGFFFAGAVAETALNKLAGKGLFTPSRDPFMDTLNSAARGIQNLDQLGAVDQPDKMLREWMDVTRALAVTPSLGVFAAMLNLVRPLVGYQLNQDKGE